jgi:hypothetical protein
MLYLLGSPLGLLGDDNARKFYNLNRPSPSVFDLEFEGQLARRDLHQGHVGVPQTGNKLHHWTMAHSELPDPARNHIHQDLLVGDDFGGGDNKFGSHNNGKLRADRDFPLVATIQRPLSL